MSEPLVSVLVAFRDRDVSRIENLFQSLTIYTKTPFEFLVCDYGSREPFQSELVLLAREKQFQIVRSEAQGLPWNKSQALNTGARAAQGSWILVVDADMVFHDAVIDHIVARLHINQIWLLESIWPQTKRQNPLKGQRHRSPGVFQLMERFWFERLHGYCEDYEFWGSEDSDWVQRVEVAGAEVNWLSADQFQLTHTWHPRENNGVTRPFSAVSQALLVEVRNAWRPYTNENWGHRITADERPILRALVSETPVDVAVAGNSVFGCIPAIKKHLENGQLVRLELGPRVQHRALTKFAGALLQLRDWLMPFSLRIEYNTQANLEVLLTLRQFLGKENLDLLLGTDYDHGYLLLK